MSLHSSISIKRSYFTYAYYIYYLYYNCLFIKRSFSFIYLAFLLGEASLSIYFSIGKALLFIL
jgi:hypothetical protein